MIEAPSVETDSKVIVDPKVFSVTIYFAANNPRPILISSRVTEDRAKAIIEGFRRLYKAMGAIVEDEGQWTRIKRPDGVSALRIVLRDIRKRPGKTQRDRMKASGRKWFYNAEQ